LIDSKRAYGISLQLGSIRGMDYETIRKAIIEMDETKITEENIGTIKQIVPTNEESVLVAGYTGEDELAEPEKFMKVMLGMSNYPERVSSWEMKMKFMTYVAGVRPPLENAILGCKELRDSKKFLEFLGLVLTIGNYLNAKNPKKIIYGFKLKSLAKLNETKASDGKTTLLQYICEFIANSKDFKELVGLPEDLIHIPPASKIAIGAIEDDIKVMKDGIKQVENYLKISAGTKIEGDNYPGKMTEFLEKAKVALETIETKLAELYTLLKEMAVLYVVDEKEVMKEPDKFFQDVEQFLDLFKGALKKNEDAKKAEEKKKKQDEDKKKKEEAAAKKSLERGKPKDKEEEGRGLVNDRGNALKDGTLLKKKQPKKKGGNDDFDDDSGGKLDSNAINKIF